MRQPIRVTIAVLTFRRPRELSIGLPFLLAQAAEVNGGQHRTDVLVVDNDPDGSAAPLVAELAGAPVPIRYVLEARPGIAAARNRALDETGASHVLLFIDDDERPEPGWLARMLATWQATGAAGVAGAVVSEFPAPLDPWIAAGGFFARRRPPTGTAVPASATNNLLLDLAEVRSRGLRFEESLGLSGGEDTLFTRSLTSGGGLIVWCDEAVVVDQVPADRATRGWVLRRSFSSGNAECHVQLLLTRGRVARGRIRARSIANALARLGAGSCRFLLGIVTRSNLHRARGLRTAARGAGMLAGASGHRYREYAR